MSYLERECLFVEKQVKEMSYRSSTAYVRVKELYIISPSEKKLYYI